MRWEDFITVGLVGLIGLLLKSLGNICCRWFHINFVSCSQSISIAVGHIRVPLHGKACVGKCEVNKVNEIKSVQRRCKKMAHIGKCAKKWYSSPTAAVKNFCILMSCRLHSWSWAPRGWPWWGSDILEWSPGQRQWLAVGHWAPLWGNPWNTWRGGPQTFLPPKNSATGSGDSRISPLCKGLSYCTNCGNSKQNDVFRHSHVHIYCMYIRNTQLTHSRHSMCTSLCCWAIPLNGENWQNTF